MSENGSGLVVVGGGAAGSVVNPRTHISETPATGARVAMTINAELVFQGATQAVARIRLTKGA